MATSPTPADYRPSQGSSAKRYMETKDANTYPNQGSSKYAVTPS